ncbi:4-oxalocrotonate tautomerase [Methylobacterium sp. Leaf465]|uniref:tautomerase family protein n=1 Tax=Methylobacterium sp. Leaf465 TaxID=1736385 RepID=UPI0006FD2608|nr:tautomerase family protein [Methylobacterium sp. Leaf465]KQT70194.1 4-oxalocrotonate tautomerase [Methylobacterium sp. Leaf465]
MPFVRVTLSGPPPSGRAREALQGGVTALMAEVLGKRADLTAVLVEGTAPGAWSIGAEPVETAAHLEATVTAGSNSPAQKAAFLAAAHRLLAETLGAALPLATYAVVNEVPAESWGYGGLTQAQRARDRG